MEQFSCITTAVTRYFGWIIIVLTLIRTTTGCMDITYIVPYKFLYINFDIGTPDDGWIQPKHVVTAVVI
jgi:hypothetical protein